MKKKYLSILLLFSLINCQSNNYSLNMNYDFLSYFALENEFAKKILVIYSINNN